MREFHFDQHGLPLVIPPDSPGEQSSEFLADWVLDQRDAIKVPSGILRIALKTGRKQAK